MHSNECLGFVTKTFLPNYDEFYEMRQFQAGPKKADIIWVALGAPKQDFFMSLLKPHLKRGVMIGVGAAFNFYSGNGEKRAPEWVTLMHLEFVYRIMQSPKKQLNRCWGIVTSLPVMLWQEWRRKNKRIDLN